ncbi:hypothetical protein [Volucribacter amazonae]|uniref:Uncharacterized protein n=1 Tax=Volucribacter amazonae TaxID=256731 RepID=A0A9X4PHL0_9PAST|nr:hypothetical protein [Volucribacter amazonae]MDG6895345.1 hypothetical protein [Volucribacter amazonae]
MINKNDTNSMQHYWSEVENYLSNLTSENMESEDKIKKQIPILSEYFYPFTLELLTDEQKDKTIEHLLNIREYFINKKNYTLSDTHCREVEKLIDELKTYLNSINGKIPNFSVLERYEKAFKKQQDEFQSRANELFGELTTHSIKKPFNEQYKEYNRKVKCQAIFFYSLLLFLFIWILIILKVITIPCLINNKILCSIFTINFDNTLEMVILRITSIIPIIWAILFLSKQISQNKKIEQAYLHKAVIAQSYLNYLELIKKNRFNLIDTNNSAQEVVNSLHKVSIEGLGLNPALLLDKSTVEKIPMEELLSKIIDKSIPVNNSPASKSKG